MYLKTFSDTWCLCMKYFKRWIRENIGKMLRRCVLTNLSARRLHYPAQPSAEIREMVLPVWYGTWWPLYGRFEVGWLQPLQLWLSGRISLVVPVLVSRNRDLRHVQLHPTWFEPAVGCRGWSVVSKLHNGHPPEGLYHGQGSPSPTCFKIPHWRIFSQSHTLYVMSRQTWMMCMAIKIMLNM